jgi:hypothetical protein
VVGAQQSIASASAFGLLDTNAPTFGKMLAAIKITPKNVPNSTVGTFFAPSDKVSSASGTVAQQHC